MSSSKEKRIILKSSDGETFEVKESVAKELATIMRMMEDDCADAVFPVPNVTGKILAKVLEYCARYSSEPAEVGDGLGNTGYSPKDWEKEFIDVNDQATLFDLMEAANYLNSKNLLDLTCWTVANMMKGKSVEEIRQIFHIKNDYTPEEEAEVRRENSWAFE